MLASFKADACRVCVCVYRGPVICMSMMHQFIFER